MNAEVSPLLTDLYQINMIQAYLDHGDTKTAVFELFARTLPARRGFFSLTNHEPDGSGCGRLSEIPVRLREEATQAHQELVELVAEHPDRFARVVASNTGLPTGDQPMPDVWLRFREVVRTAPTLSVSRLVQAGCQTRLPPEVLAAYEAPFPDPAFAVAVRAMPNLVPTTPDDPAAEANRAAWRRLSFWDKPFLVAFSDRDPITGAMAPILARTIPGAAGLEHPVIAGAGHFLQEDAPHEVGRAINRALAQKSGPIVPLIAETGGINAMIVDATALPEQVSDDVIASAFRSAGQRCSALRLLYVQDDVADALIEMLSGAMDELIIGDPADPATDVGPVISAQAAEQLEAHATRLRRQARMFKECRVPSAFAQGHFVAPKLFELNDGRELGSEQFGPILHLVRYPARALDSVLETIRTSGYGLTLGIHSRISGMWQQVVAGTRVGNTYVNRNMIGAVVGVQPFGGEGLSGTGPKAGGPHYLLRFTTERTLTVNTVATGGNAELLSQSS